MFWSCHECKYNFSYSVNVLFYWFLEKKKSYNLMKSKQLANKNYIFYNSKIKINNKFMKKYSWERSCMKALALSITLHGHHRHGNHGNHCNHCLLHWWSLINPSERLVCVDCLEVPNVGIVVLSATVCTDAQGPVLSIILLAWEGYILILLYSLLLEECSGFRNKCACASRC